MKVTEKKYINVHQNIGPMGGIAKNGDAAKTAASKILVSCPEIT
jgi:hypothetical protein